MFRSFVLLLGLMSVTELSANPDLSALESGMDAPTMGVKTKCDKPEESNKPVNTV
jgi:hypothetical protein